MTMTADDGDSGDLDSGPAPDRQKPSDDVYGRPQTQARWKTAAPEVKEVSLICPLSREVNFDDQKSGY